jgi:murein DD-endopeptidase MepM/ murein hydrolase activator NlpD
MHSGHVTRIAQPLGRLGCVYVEAADMISVYAHLHLRIPTPERDGLKVGDHVEGGQLLGWVGRILNDPHLHLEVWVHRKGLAAPKPAELAQKIGLLITGVAVHAS